MKTSAFEELSKTFKGKKCFVTGHTGFKGSWLVLTLLKMGANVVGYALPASKDGLFNELSLDVKSYFEDIRDKKLLVETIEKEQPDYVFHLAAQAIVIDSYKDPQFTYETNVIGTLNLLEAVKNTNSTKSVLIVTTDKVYENKEWDFSYRENDQLGGHDIYSSSKACCEVLVSSYTRSFFHDRDIRVITARSGNVIGGGDWTDNRIIPDIFRAIKSNKSLEIRSPNAVRPWLHVLETINGYCQLISKSENHFFGKSFELISSWNIAPFDNSNNTIQKLIDDTLRITNSKLTVLCPEEFKLHEANYLSLSNEKICKLLGWSPRWDYKKTIEKTALWYNSFLNGNCPRELCENDIKAFFSEAE